MSRQFGKGFNGAKRAKAVIARNHSNGLVSKRSLVQGQVNAWHAKRRRKSRKTI